MFRQNRLRENLRLRAEVIDAIRAFFRAQDFLEVETPVRQPTQAPEAHIDPQTSGSWLLQTSPELCMKRLLAAGYDKIFQICRCFRTAERGRRHLPEMTLLEWYTAGADYRGMMDQTEALIRHVARALGRGDHVSYQGEKISLSTPWQRMRVAEAFTAHSGVSITTAMTENRFDEILAFEIEPQLGRGRPLFLIDYPPELAALARLRPDEQDVAERFELYICGLELCNGFSELTDPEEQRRRFQHENEQRRAARKPPLPLPETFLTALAHMPAAAGNALGLDRLVMLMADTKNIDDVVAFVPEEL